MDVSSTDTHPASLKGCRPIVGGLPLEQRCRRIGGVYVSQRGTREGVGEEFEVCYRPGEGCSRLHIQMITELDIYRIG